MLMIRIGRYGAKPILIDAKIRSYYFSLAFIRRQVKRTETTVKSSDGKEFKIKDTQVILTLSANVKQIEPAVDKAVQNSRLVVFAPWV